MVFPWTRNPMYLGMVLIVAGAALAEGSVSPWLAVIALAVVLDRCFIAREEATLRAAFGDAYRSYQARVRRWI